MAIEDLDERGFIKVTAPGEPDIWLTCDACGKSDHFKLTDAVECACGARYDHAKTPGGQRVGLEGLTFVEFSKGPMTLADLEMDPRKVAVWVAVVVAVVVGAWWALA